MPGETVTKAEALRLTDNQQKLILAWRYRVPAFHDTKDLQQILDEISRLPTVVEVLAKNGIDVVRQD